MANDDFPRGLIPVTHRGQTLRTRKYEADSSGVAAPIFFGQPVVQQASGLISNAAPLGASGVVYLGVAVGFLDANDGVPATPYNDSGGTARRYVVVADDPDQEFEIQSDTGGTLATYTDRGATIDLLYRSPVNSVGSGSNITGFANLEIDGSSAVATNSGAVMLIRIKDQTNTDGTQNAPGNYCKWIVRITNHQLRGQPIVNTAV